MRMNSQWRIPLDFWKCFQKEDGTVLVAPMREDMEKQRRELMAEEEEEQEERIGYLIEEENSRWLLQNTVAC